MNPLIISRLIEAGYEVYLPVDGSSEIVIGKDKTIKKCLCINASRDQERAPLLRCPKDEKLVAACDKTTRTVWLLDGGFQAGSVMRLGKRYEDYIIPEPSSLSWKEQKEMRMGRDDELRDQAMAAGEKYR